jgi:hypothetical protein
LVFEDDDPYGGRHVGAMVAHLTGAGGKPNLVAGVAAVTAARAVRIDQFRLAEPTQDSGEQPTISAARPIV